MPMAATARITPAALAICCLRRLPRAAAWPNGALRSAFGWPPWGESRCGSSSIRNSFQSAHNYLNHIFVKSSIHSHYLFLIVLIHLGTGGQNDVDFRENGWFGGIRANS